MREGYEGLGICPIEGDKWSVKYDVRDLRRSFGYYLSWMVLLLWLPGFVWLFLVLF